MTPVLYNGSPVPDFHHGSATELPDGLQQYALDHKPLPPAPPAKLTGHVIGYRGWYFEGYMLKSSSMPYQWHVGDNQAECEARKDLLQGRPFVNRVGEVIGDHHPTICPNAECECGLYAMHDARFALAMATLPNMIGGAVAAWGRIETHAYGFRAQHAKPILFTYDQSDDPELVERKRAIAGELDIPLVPFEQLEQEACNHGAPVPVEERPTYTWNCLDLDALLLHAGTMWAGQRQAGPSPRRRQLRLVSGLNREARPTTQRDVGINGQALDRAHAGSSGRLRDGTDAQSSASAIANSTAAAINVPCVVIAGFPFGLLNLGFAIGVGLIARRNWQRYRTLRRTTGGQP